MLNKNRLLTPGPTPLPETVRLALARDMSHHRSKDFKALMLAVQRKLQTLFGTKEPVLPLACSGTGAMTAAVSGLFSPGEKVLVIDGGKFGERWRKIAQQRGLQVQSLQVPYGEAVEPEAVIQALGQAPKHEGQAAEFSGVLIQLCETSTGVQHPIEALAKALHGRKELLVVDGISGVGITPCPLDDWGLDCLLTGSQKGLMLPPGLSLLALSERAWSKAEKTDSGCFYFNLPRERQALSKGQTLFTTAVNLIVGLDASLDLLLGGGLEKIYAKQWAMTMLCRTGVTAMGLELFAKKDFSWGVTSVRLPDGLDGQDLIQYALEHYGVCMAGGQDELKGKIVRIGHMGWVDWSDILAGLYALNRSLLALGGYSAARDYLETAMAAYRIALDGRPGAAIPQARICS